MLTLVDCSGCRTPLQLPLGARSIRCAICQAVTNVARPSLPPPLHGQMPEGQPSRMHGRKKAVICGVSYRYSRNELKGCVNDAKCMKYLLMNKFKFPETSVLMLTEEETDPYKVPTKQNIRMALYWLVQGCQPGDSLVFHFSGHSSKQRNYYKDEVDGYNRTLCPVDFETQGMIVDDEINATIVRPLPHGVKLHAVIDASHTGTVLDLPFLCRMNRNGQYVWEDNRPQSGVWKGTSGGEVICFSGSGDDQVFADTSALSTGAMTYSFIHAIENGNAITYGSLLNSMRSTICNTFNSLGDTVVRCLLPMLLRQEPQLTANEPFDVYMKPFSLI